jgi:hypothetical protein
MGRSLAGLGVGSLLAGALIAPVTAQDETAPPEVPSTPAEVVTLGANQIVLRDGFDVPAAWGTVDDDSGAIEYGDGVMRFVLREVPNAKWNWLDLVRQAPVLWVRASLGMRAGGGAGGAMCGTAAVPPVHVFAIVSTDGEWIIGRTSGSELGVYERGPLPPRNDLSDGGSAVVSLECAMTGPAGDRVAMWIDGMNVADISIPEALGPYSSAGLYGEGYEEGFRVVFDDVVAAMGESYTPIVRAQGTPEPAVVPSDGPSSSPGADASVAPEASIAREASARPEGSVIPDAPARPEASEPAG